MSLVVIIFWAATVNAAVGRADKAPAPIVVAQARYERSSIVRIRPAVIPVPSVAAPQIRWKEKKAPKCIQVNALAGALVSSPTSIDLVLRGGTRLRAKLAKTCTAIDFYQGFYVKPSRDGRICEDRDDIRSRLGARCEITKFNTLVPEKG